MRKRYQRGFTSLVAMAAIASGCASGATATPSDIATGTPIASVPCTSDELDGTYRRTITSSDTSNSDLYGEWTLEIGDCNFTISADDATQGGGRIELVDGTAESGRIALSEDVCPNEFTGEGFYDVSLNGDQLQIEEAIQASDQCEGRAEAFVTPPLWERDAS
jgi:hypothetical protein